MTKIVFAMAALSALCLTAPAMAQDTGLTGDWTMTSHIAGTDRQSDCTFTTTGAAFTGTCKREDSTATLTGSVDKDGVHIKGASSYGGAPIDLTYEAKMVDATTVKGTVHVEPYKVDGDFTLVKK